MILMIIIFYSFFCLVRKSNELPISRFDYGLPDGTPCNQKQNLIIIYCQLKTLQMKINNMNVKN